MGGIFRMRVLSPRSLLSALRPRVRVIWKMVVLGTEITETREGFIATWRRGKGVVQVCRRIWEGVEFSAGCKDVHFW